MKKITTTISGGQPYRTDDIALAQENVKELTSAIAQGLSFDDTPFRLFGGDITVNNSGGVGVTLDITTGALWRTDEIYLIDVVSGQALPDFTTTQDILDTWEWDLSVTTTENVLFKDSSSHDIHEFRKAILTDSPSTWAGIETGIFLYEDIIRKETNIDILANDYQNPHDFDTLYDDSSSNIYKEYPLSSGEHILRLTTPSSGNATIARLLPPSDVFDGYELTIEIITHPTANRGLGFYRGTAGGNITANINLQLTKIPYTTGGVTEIKDRTDFYVSFDSAEIGGARDLYIDSGTYDFSSVAGGTFKLLLRWNNTSNQWDEIARSKHLS